MWFKHHSIQALFLFISILLFILLMAISFWNYSLKDHVSLNAWPLVFLILAIVSAALFYTLYLKATDQQITENMINQKVAEERARILSEMDNKEEVTEIENIEQDERASKIIPKGNIKTAESFARKLLANLASELEVVLGVIYMSNSKHNLFSFLAGFALPADQKPPDFKAGENLNGQVAKNKEILVLRNLPAAYFNIESGLGSSKPRSLIIAPLVNNNKTVAIIEIATFIDIDKNTETFVNKVCTLAADKLASFK
jgi:23S rRNA maturation mini-RNase III